MREGCVLGNLVCHRGKVISQGWDSVEVFRQIDALHEDSVCRLKANPDDAEALRLQGESRLDEGNLAEAIQSLRKALHLEPEDTQTQDLLRKAFLEGLRRDFATYGGYAQEIEPLLHDASHRIRYARLMDENLRKTGQWRPVFDLYLRLIDLDGGDRVLELAGPSWLTRSDRWFWSRLRSLCGKADDKAMAEIDRTLETRLKAALQSKSLNRLRKFVADFDGHKAAVVARELINRSIESEQYLEAELLLWRDWQSLDPAVAGPAVAQMAKMLTRAKRFHAAAACYQRLGREFADVVCGEGKTGKQMIATLPRQGKIQQVLNADTVWPSGEVNVDKQPSQANNIQQAYNLRPA